MIFRDRLHAASLLAARLAPWRGRDPLIVAIPRGAVPMGALIARELDADLDVVLVRKLPAPGHPELAVGAIDEAGATYLTPHAGRLGAASAYLERVGREALALLAERRRLYTPGRKAVDPGGRIVVVVDDGLATGSTMVAALRALRARKPARLICAVPVASREALALVQRKADEVVCLDAPDAFSAVGQAYLAFDQVSDAEVVATLRRHETGRQARAAGARESQPAGGPG